MYLRLLSTGCFALTVSSAQIDPIRPVEPIAQVMLAQRSIVISRDSEDRLYRKATSYLDRGDWEKAAQAFDEVIAKKQSRVDGAYYWKAYAMAKLGRREAASEALKELQHLQPGSPWLNDAKALALELGQASGQVQSPEKQTDEDLKLMAINGLMASDPERALPLLEKVLASSTSPRLRERALFVLAQNRTAQAREIVAQYAKGKGNPDLQMKAIEYLGVLGGRETLQTLNEVYTGTSDPAIRRRILRSFMIAGDRDRITQIAKSEPNLDVRREAYRQLGMMGASSQLSQLYSSEASVELREEIIRSFLMTGNTEKLGELARSEKDVRLRKAAIRYFASMGRRPGSTETLVALYGSETDAGLKREILRGLFVQGDAKPIVQIARSESDISLKREAVQQLSLMKSKDATDYMLELLNK